MAVASTDLMGGPRREPEQLVLGDHLEDARRVALFAFVAAGEDLHMAEAELGAGARATALDSGARVARLAALVSRLGLPGQPAALAAGEEDHLVPITLVGREIDDLLDAALSERERWSEALVGGLAADASELRTWYRARVALAHRLARWMMETGGRTA
jgi:hypothetical protein